MYGASTISHSLQRLSRVEKKTINWKLETLSCLFEILFYRCGAIIESGEVRTLTLEPHATHVSRNRYRYVGPSRASLYKPLLGPEGIPDDNVITEDTDAPSQTRGRGGEVGAKRVRRNPHAVSSSDHSTDIRRTRLR